MKYILIFFFAGCATINHGKEYVVTNKTNGITHLRDLSNRRSDYIFHQPNAFKIGDTVWAYKTELTEIYPHF